MQKRWWIVVAIAIVIIILILLVIKKMKAIKCYDSQFYSVNKKSEPETYISSKLFYYDIESKARYYGFKIGTEFGEPFYCEENLKINSKNLFEI